MFNSFKTLNILFAQLGLPDDDASIEKFIKEHKPLSPEVELARAPWWSRAQSCFLDEAIEHDAEWADAADVLDTMLRD